MIPKITITILCLLITGMTYAQTTYYVDAATGNNTNDGLSWAMAFADIQVAIDAAAAGDEIRVASGTYFPTEAADGSTADSRQRAFHIDEDITLRGSYTPDGDADPSNDVQDYANPSILTGDFNGDDVVTGSGQTLSITGNTENAIHVLITVDLTNAAIIDGFTITGGNAPPGVGNITFSGRNISAQDGGGIYNRSSSPTISQCIFTGNRASNLGGGLYIELSSPILDNCTISLNEARDGAGLYSDGGGIGNPNITGTTFSGNSSGSEGGGVYLFSSDATISQSIFVDNHADDGGGLYLRASSPVISNVLFQDNTADAGAGVYAEPNNDLTHTITNATFVNNTASVQSGGLFGTDETLLYNSVFYGNTAPADPHIRTGLNDDNIFNVAVDYSEINTNHPVRTSTNPVDLTGVPPTLIFIDPTDPDGTDNILGTADDGWIPAAGGFIANAGDNSLNTEPIDLTGQSRIFDTTIDIGAYETQMMAPVGNGVLYVDASRPANTGDGLSWPTALRDIQVAIDLADAGDEIRVASGTYFPTASPDGSTASTNQWAFHIDEDITLRGSYTPDGDADPSNDVQDYANPSILSGDFDGDDVVTGSGQTLSITNISDNAFHVLITVGLTNAAIIDGLTITSGNAAGGDITFSGQNILGINGGGVYNVFSSPTISQCTITGNRVLGFGGGMYNQSSTSLMLDNCTVSQNVGNTGAGFYIVGGDNASITQSTFSGNNAVNEGGGVFLSNSDMSISQSIFIDSQADEGGGLLFRTSSPTISNVLFQDNTADEGAGVYADFVNDQAHTISNATFVNNAALVQSGGLFGTGETLLYNSIFYGNTAPIDPHIRNDLDRDNIFNVAVDFTELASIHSVRTSTNPVDLDGIAATAIFTDPADPDGADNILGTADDGWVPVAGGPINNAGDNSLNTEPTDLAGQTRIFDTTIDIGAYETQVMAPVGAAAFQYTLVDPVTDMLTITNLGTVGGDVGTAWLCLGPGTYVQINNIATQSTILAPGESITLPYTMDEVDDGLSLFATDSFISSDPNILLDFVQWGAGNQPRSGQAVTAGRWDDATSFVVGQPPYTTMTGGSAAAWMSCITIAGDITFDVAANPSILISADMLTATICQDGVADPLTAIVAPGSMGTFSGWVITDDTGLILDAEATNPFDLDGAPPGICNVYYIRYEAGLTGLINGENIDGLLGCFDLSNALTVIRLSAANGECNLPDFVGSIPEANSTDVALASTITLIFSDTVPTALLNTMNIIIHSEQQGLLMGTFSGGGTSMVVFTPDEDFLPGDLITVTVTDAVADTMEVFQFTTASGAAPTCLGFFENIVDTDSQLPLGAAVGDLDGDGDIDFAIASRNDDIVAWYENDGASTPSFTKRIVTNAADGAGSVALGDVDNDGDLDIFATSQLDDSVRVFINDGGTPPNFTAAFTANIDGAQNVTVGDVNGDGQLDFVVAAFFANTIRYYQNDGSAPLSFSPSDVDAAATTPQSVALGDLDNDGDLDIMAALFSGEIVWYENDGTIAPSFTRHNILGGFANAISVRPGDIDGDGDLDIAAASLGNNTVAWLENDGAVDPSFTQRVISNTVASARRLSVGDIDGDGDLDIFATSNTNNQFILFENNGATDPAFSETLIMGVTTGAQISRLADIDGDGDLDILFAAATANTVSWFETGELNITAGDVTFGPAPNSTVLISEDSTSVTICRDGQADPLTVNVGPGSEGSNSGWIITDAATGNILMRPDMPPFDLDGAGPGICNIYYIRYEDGLNGDTIGGNIDSITGCFDLSNALAVIRALPNAGVLGIDATATIDANPSTQVEGTTATICIGSGAAPVFVTKTGYETNLSYLYVITDENNVILDITDASAIDLTDAGPGTCRIWGWSYRGTPDMGASFIGGPLADLEAELSCSDVSENFVTVIRLSAAEGECEIVATIPTMGEWALCCLFLILLTIGVVALRSSERAY